MGSHIFGFSGKDVVIITVRKRTGMSVLKVKINVFFIRLKKKQKKKMGQFIKIQSD